MSNSPIAEASADGEAELGIRQYCRANRGDFRSCLTVIFETHGADRCYALIRTAI
jgi:hypothetical protein